MLSMYMEADYVAENGIEMQSNHILFASATDE
jgi:hypothetical protein